MRLLSFKALLALIFIFCSIQATANDITAAEAFFDNPDLPEGSGIAVSPSSLGLISLLKAQIDTSSLSDGLHVLYTRSKDSSNNWSEPLGHIFIKVAEPPAPGNHVAEAEYFFNGNDLGVGNNPKIPVAADLAVYENIAEQVMQNVDASNLNPGLNSISYRTRNNAGYWSPLITNVFKRPAGVEMPNQIVAAEFYVGVDPGPGNGTPITGSFDDWIEAFDRGDLHAHNVPGLYTVGFRSKNSDGHWSPTMIQRYVVPEGGLPDPPGVSVSALSGNTSESGNQATFTIVLDVQPSADVSMSISSSDTSEGIVDKSSLTFTTANWDVPQTVTITGMDDPFLDGDVAYKIYLSSVTSTDEHYNGKYGQTLFITNVDYDGDAPQVSVSIPSGSYEYSQSVAISCSDQESGCQQIYYTLDNTTPTNSSIAYTGPVSIEKNTYLKSIAVDNAGQVSSVLTQYYEITTVDDVAPSINITTPADGGNYESLFIIDGTASDALSGVASVKIQITDGTRYWGPLFDGYNWVDEPHWLDAFPGDPDSQPIDWSTWGFNATTVDLYDGTTYTITAKAIDASGNEAVDSVIFSLAGNQAYTTLTASLSSQTILQNETLDISGKLTRLPETNISLGGRQIKLTITKPDLSQTVLTTDTYDVYGHYIFQNIDAFNIKGTYELKLEFEATNLLSASDVTTSVLVGSSAGYAIILQGKHPSEEGLASHNKTTNRIYATLKERGFIDENIFYLNYDNTQTGVDGLPSKAAVADALTTWLPSRVNGSPAPMYLIFADHGNPDTFYLDNETFNATELNGWLNDLESSLSPTALLEPRTVIYGACYSGSFLPKLSKASSLTDAGRIIVTSSAANEVSYKGPNEPDNIRSGEYFLEALFKQLGRGDSLAKSFKKATRVTERYTRKGGGFINSGSGYFDSAVQHPLLDDNGDGEGTNLLSEGADDGSIANHLFLGSGLNYDTNSILNPAEVVDVAPVQILDPNSSGALIWLKANDDSSVSSAWAEIRSPETQLSPTSSTEQQSNNLPRILMTFNQRTEHWEATYPDFTSAGRYEIYYFVKDNESGDISPMKQGSVYKQLETNTAPVSGNLLSPADTSTTRTVLLFDWEDSTDADSHEVFYTLEIASDTDFANIVHRQEDLTQSFAVVDNSAGLEDLKTYYWRVRSIDSFGASSVTSYWIFNTDNTNGIPGILKGIVYSDIDFSRLPAVSLNATNQTGGSPVIAVSDNNGEFVILINDGLIDLVGSLAGFANASKTAVKVLSGEITELNIGLHEADSDGDGVADSVDAFPDDAIGSNDTIDHDADGLPDVFEAQYGFLDPLDANDAALDQDEDGYTNKEEYDAGTSPDDANDVPRRSSIIIKLLPLLLEELEQQ